MRRDVPEPWATALIEAGITDPRYTEPRPSMSQLAKQVGVHTSTITGLVFAEKETDQRIVDAVANVLHVTPATVAEWVGRTEANPYTPPSTAALMTVEERQHVDWIIRRFTRDRATTSDVRAEVEHVEGVARLTHAELKGELRAAIRRRNELVHPGRHLAPDEAELLVLLTEKIARLEHALTPSVAPSATAETG